MRFRLTEDQVALRDGVREMLGRCFDAGALRAAVDAPRLDRALWRELGAVGFFALRLPEAEGGVGLGLPEAVVAFEEAGRVLLPGPLVATHLAAGRVAGAAAGETVVTVVDGGLVEWLEEADVVDGWECSAGDGDVRVGGADPGVGAQPGTTGCRCAEPDRGAVPLRSVDPLTPLHRVAGGCGGCGADPVAVLLTAAEQVGSAARVCELAVRHARVREQFGRPIGAFQAVQHLCADLFARVEMARVAVYAAAVTGDPVDIAAARLLADEAAVRGARECVQVHGGMGFTWEAEIHLHLKRAWVRTRRAGGGTESEELLAEDLVWAGGGWGA